MKLTMSYWNFQAFPNHDTFDPTKPHDEIGSGDSIWYHETPDEMAENLKKLGANHAVSFVYFGPDFRSKRYPNGCNQHKEDVIAYLDACHKRGITVTMMDRRVEMWHLHEVGEVQFREDVKRAIEDFGHHPAVTAYFIGDEPWGDMMKTAAQACRILKEYAPDHIEAFLNHLPVLLDPETQRQNITQSPLWFEEFMALSGATILSYDNYAACAVYDEEKYKDDWFHNIRIFGEIARKHGARLYACPNALGYACVRKPDDNDARYMMSAYVASGAEGLTWFELFDSNDYRGTMEGSPYDYHYEKSPTFDVLSRQVRIFMEVQAKALKDYDFVWAKHVYKSYGCYPMLDPKNDGIEVIGMELPTPMIVTKFVHHDTGRVRWAITNNSQKQVTSVRVTYKNANGEEKTSTQWMLPGQMIFKDC